MEVQIYFFVPGYSEMNENVTRDMQSTNNVDQNHLESQILPRSPHWTKNTDFGPFWAQKGLFSILFHIFDP